jgi:hypothetical protein
LVFGCAYRRIADESCSATTLRQRRDEWIELGEIDALREAVLEAFHHAHSTRFRPLLRSSSVKIHTFLTKSSQNRRST